MQALITKGTPLVFAFHGTGGDEHQFSGLVKDFWPQAGLIAPRGKVLEHGANRFFRRTSEGVYDMEDLAVRTTAMIALVRNHKTSGVPTCAFGYSNGANILAAMTFEAPDLFDAVALLHPLVPWSPEPQPGLKDRRILITAGRNDMICPLPLTTRLGAYYERQQAQVDMRLHDGGHEIRQEELAILRNFLDA